MLTPTTPTISAFTASEMSQLTTSLHVRAQIVWATRGLCPLPTPINRGNPPPPLKFLPYSIYLGQRVIEKPSNVLAIFMGLSLTPIITNIWSAS